MAEVEYAVAAAVSVQAEELRSVGYSHRRPANRLLFGPFGTSKLQKVKNSIFETNQRTCVG